MPASRPPSPTILRLVDELTGASAPDVALTGELAGWIATAPGFRAFAETERPKIRKKLRTATDPEARRDVRTELLAARLLLADRRLALRFEPHGSGRRGPDFAVTLRGQPPFEIEVTRPRRTPTREVVAAAIVGKLRQLQPGVANLLVLAVEIDRAGSVDVAAAVTAIRTRADARDATFLAAAEVDGSRAFYDRFLRLGGVLVWNEAGRDGGRAALWINPSARIPLPPRVGRACLAAFEADPVSR